MDLTIAGISIITAYLLRYNFNIPDETLNKFTLIVIYVLSIRTITFYISKLYAGVVRFTSAKDAERIFLVNLIGSILLLLTNLIVYFIFEKQFIIPTSIIIIDFFVTAFIMTSSRLIIKTIYQDIINPTKYRINVVILGADEFGTIAKHAIEREINSKEQVIAFLDDRPSHIGKKVEGIPVYDYRKFNELTEEYDITNLIISSKNINILTRDNIINQCLEKKIKVFYVPDIDTWLYGELTYNQIKGIEIEDLLEREPIVLDKKNIQKDLINRIILITGAAGSIGSELVRQIIKYYPKKILIFDQAESPLYDLELELTEKYKFHDFEVIIGDVTNYYRLELIFQKYRPSVVYHAAAYKHVPMMEKHPSEAVITNVVGTKNLADLSALYKVSKFVMISTDKAVNPTNVMGASKRIAEKYIQILQKKCSTHFITTRFGNVLGSQGSVIPRFKKQILSGGPVTITHPEVTRYFMTIPEACQLVLEAGAMGKGGEIFLFDMGKPVKIIDLAKKMIDLYGLTLGKNIKISYTGLRPGEKLYEELLTDKENTVPTHHSQIMIAKVENFDSDIIQKEIDKLIDLLPLGDNFEIVKQMKIIVPEFKSQNSVYQKIDIMFEEAKMVEKNQEK
jgi:FlaA1/EpsC-like NDP-sugar epimerase